MRKLCLLFILFIVVVSITYVSPFTYFMHHRMQQEILIVPETKQFPSVQLVDFAGESITFDSSPKDKIVFSLSSTCSHCISLLDLIERLCYFNDGSKLPIYIVWNDQIPTERLKKRKFPEDINLGLIGGSKLTMMTPDCILLDQENNIVYRSNSGFNSLILEKYMNIVGIPSEALVLDYLKNKYSLPSQGKFTVFFTIDQCSGCEEEKTKISDLARQKRIALKNILEIGREHRNDTNYIYDDTGFLGRALGVEWYPHFLVFDLQTGQRFDGRKIEDVLQRLN